MLRYSVSPSRNPVGDLSPDEYMKLRHAFGCAAENRYRADGERIVSFHYEKDRWFLCDCRPDAKRPPTLFLTVNRNIQREDKGDGTPHAEDCVFAREDGDQKRLVRSYRLRSDNERQFNLVRGFGDGKKVPPGPPSIITRYEERSELATVLYELLHAAKLDRLFSSEPLRGDTREHGEELRNRANQLLREAAQSFFLTQKRPVSEWLATGIEDYNALKKRLKQKHTGWSRPHGLFIDVFYTIKDKGLYLQSGKLFATVTGKFGTFGEQEADIRPPYLVIGLLTRPHRDFDEIELLKAYAHPCVAWDRLMLVDSKLERKTLALLVKCRDWLAKKHNVKFSIEKPLFDVSADKTDEAREICKPDFIVRNQNRDAAHPLIVIETMGYDTPAYRERKRRMRPLFERIGNSPKPVPVIEHDYFLPGKRPEEVDDQFFRAVCAVILRGKKGESV